MTDTSPSPPTGIERRLSLRILGYWRGLHEGDEIPSFSDIDPEAIPDMWPYCIVLYIEGHESDPLLTYCGEVLREICGEDFTDKPLSAVPQNSLAARALSYYKRVLDKRVPITCGDEFINDAGNKVLYRSAILPLSDDGETIDRLLCATNCREVILEYQEE